MFVENSLFLNFSLLFNRPGLFHNRQYLVILTNSFYKSGFIFFIAPRKQNNQYN